MILNDTTKIDAEPYLKAVAEATDANDHTHARKLIAMYVKRKHKGLGGIDKLEKCFDAITTLQDFYKNMPDDLQKIRKDIEIATFSYLNDAEEKAFYESL